MTTKPPTKPSEPHDVLLARGLLAEWTNAMEKAGAMWLPVPVGLVPHIKRIQDYEYEQSKLQQAEQ